MTNTTEAIRTKLDELEAERIAFTTKSHLVSTDCLKELIRETFPSAVKFDIYREFDKHGYASESLASVVVLDPADSGVEQLVFGPHEVDHESEKMVELTEGEGTSDLLYDLLAAVFETADRECYEMTITL